VAGAYITLYLNITDSVPEPYKSLFASTSRKKGEKIDMEFKRRAMFLIEPQTEAAQAYAALRVEVATRVNSGILRIILDKLDLLFVCFQIIIFVDK
jgi:hypothetical protein